jgi:hypothetical protein
MFFPSNYYWETGVKRGILMNFLSIQMFRRQIQEALNKQTYHQFLAYAQQTHPGQPEKVSVPSK